MHIVSFTIPASNFRVEEKKSVYQFPSRVRIPTIDEDNENCCRGNSRSNRERQIPAPVKEQKEKIYGLTDRLQSSTANQRLSLHISS